MAEANVTSWPALPQNWASASFFPYKKLEKHWLSLIFWLNSVQNAEPNNVKIFKNLKFLKFKSAAEW